MGVDPVTLTALTTIAMTALKGAAVGAAVGGVGGAVTGGPQGALKGAAIGAGAGALTGGVAGGFAGGGTGGATGATGATAAEGGAIVTPGTASGAAGGAAGTVGQATGKGIGAEPATNVDPATGLPQVGMGAPSATGSVTPKTTPSATSSSVYGKADVKQAARGAISDKITGAGTRLAEAGATSGLGMLASKALAGDTSPSSVPPPAYGQTDTTGAQKAAERERRRQMGKGRASTILTSPLGLSKPPSVGSKVLLGS